MTTEIRVWLVAQIICDDDDANPHNYDLDLAPIASGDSPVQVIVRLANNISGGLVLDDIINGFSEHVAQMNKEIELCQQKS